MGLADRAIATIGRSNCSSLWPVADVSSASRAPHAKTKGQSSDKSGSTVRFLILCHQLDPTHAAALEVLTASLRTPGTPHRTDRHTDHHVRRRQHCAGTCKTSLVPASLVQPHLKTSHLNVRSLLFGDGCLLFGEMCTCTNRLIDDDSGVPPSTSTKHVLSAQTRPQLDSSACAAWLRSWTASACSLMPRVLSSALLGRHPTRPSLCKWQATGTMARRCCWLLLLQSTLR